MGGKKAINHAVLIDSFYILYPFVISLIIQSRFDELKNIFKEKCIKITIKKWCYFKLRKNKVSLKQAILMALIKLKLWKITRNLITLKRKNTL